jgi:hypothetical protein
MYVPPLTQSLSPEVLIKLLAASNASSANVNEETRGIAVHFEPTQDFLSAYDHVKLFYACITYLKGLGIPEERSGVCKLLSHFCPLGRSR